MQQVLPRELVWETGLHMYTDFFPAPMLDYMTRAALRQSERKVLHSTLSGTPFPEPFNAAAQYTVANTSANAINTLIVKRYELDEPSLAFDLHYDPEEYDNYLALCSLGGFALLTVIDMNVGQMEFECRSNTVMLLPAYGLSKLHKISAPNQENGIRPFAFFGHHFHN